MVLRIMHHILVRTLAHAKTLVGDRPVTPADCELRLVQSVDLLTWEFLFICSSQSLLLQQPTAVRHARSAVEGVTVIRYTKSFLGAIRNGKLDFRDLLSGASS